MVLFLGVNSSFNCLIRKDTVKNVDEEEKKKAILNLKTWTKVNLWLEMVIMEDEHVNYHKILHVFEIYTTELKIQQVHFGSGLSAFQPSMQRHFKKNV